jgi:hypothetical protein
MRLRRDRRDRRQLRQVSPRRAHQAVRRSARPVWRDLRVRDLYQSSKEFGLMDRAMGFAALAMLTVVPLLVVVAAAGALSRHGLARWIVYGMGLSGSSAHAVVQLSSAPGRVLGTTSIFSGLLLAAFGVTFAGSVQAAFERIWDLPAGPWHKIWRQVVWLIVFIGYIYVTATVGPLTHHAAAATITRVSVAVVLGIAFFWWGLHFLVGGRVFAGAVRDRMIDCRRELACLRGRRRCLGPENQGWRGADRRVRVLAHRGLGFSTGPGARRGALPAPRARQRGDH